MNLFTYGSLMFDAVWSRLVSQPYENSPAALSGYARKCVSGDSYPVVFKGDEYYSIAGMLYFNITPQDLAVLDEFEGEYYLREAVQVRLPDGSFQPAETYVLKDEFRHLASDRDWDADRFATDGIHHFIEKYSKELGAE